MTTITSSQYASRLQKEPLLFAKTAVANNPNAINANMVGSGFISHELDVPELLDAVLQIAKELSPTQLKELFDVPFSFDTSNEGSTPGIFEAFEEVAEKQQIPEEEQTWSHVFPESASAVGEAHADFTSNLNPNTPALTSGKQPGFCKHRAMRQLRNVVYVGIALLLLISIIKVLRR